MSHHYCGASVHVHCAETVFKFLRHFHAKPPVLLCALMCQGCFFFSSTSHPVSVQIPFAENDGAVFHKAANSADAVYDADSGGGHVTAIKECDARIHGTIETRTRELFVGFNDLQVTTIELLPLVPQAVQRATFNARLADDSASAVSLSGFVYSFVDGKCTFDLVLWNQSATAEALAQVQSVFEKTLPQIVPAMIGAR